MSGAEVLGIISAVISIVDATIKVYNAAKDEAGLPPNFKTVATKLPLVSKLVEDAERYVDEIADDTLTATFTPVLGDCRDKATQLRQLFEKVIPIDGDSRMERYFKAARTIGKGGRVETLMKGILDNLRLLTAKFPKAVSRRGQENLTKAIEEVSELEPSLSDGFENAPTFAHYGSGAQNVNTGVGSQYNNNSTGSQNNGPGNQYIGTNHIDTSIDLIAFGIQARTINGPVNAESHHYPAPERPETPPNPSILIPFGRDRDFVERGEVIDHIQHCCSPPGSRTALVGLGGVGKSQLAIECAYRIRERSSDTWVFWIHASNSARFEEGFRDVATLVKVPGRQNPKANIFQLVHDWLQDERKGPWVIVLDNVDDPSFLKLPDPDIEAGATTTKSASTKQLISFIPYCQHGSVLITSRSRDAALELVEHANIIAIEPMNEKDAMRLFQNKLGQSDTEACGVELAAALEYMPMAIVQAAAYIVQRRPRCSLRKYLDEFRMSDRKKANLLGFEGGKLRRDAKAKNSILITWQISFDYIQDTIPSAADLLSLMSFCDRQGIPEILLRGQNDHMRGDGEQNQCGETNNSGVGEHNNASNDESIDSDSGSDSTEQQSNYSDNDSFEQDIVTLRNYSFIIANDGGTTFEMHRLVQLATLEWLKAHGVYEQWRHQFLVRLCREMPAGEYENWSKCQALFPHAQSVSAQRPAAKESMKEWATILYKAAWYALRQGKGTEAENLSVRAMKARKRIFDKEHEDVIWSKAMVALAYSLRGRWSEAERLEVQVMETSKTKLGADHPATLTSMANLASTYRNQGRWEEAERLDVQVMETSKTKLGADHPATLSSMHNLAYSFKSLGRLDEALDLMDRCSSLRQRILGLQHPHTKSSKEAMKLWQQGSV